jgi:hypothetical protein
MFGELNHAPNLDDLLAALADEVPSAINAAASLDLAEPPAWSVGGSRS